MNEDRRRHLRDEAFLVAEYRKVKIYIADISESGMKLLSEVPFANEGEEIELHIHVPSTILEDIYIPGTVMWVEKKPIEGTISTGLELSDFDEIKAIISQIGELNSFITKMRQNF